jgi:hypothetical protein
MQNTKMERQENVIVTVCLTEQIERNQLVVVSFILKIAFLGCLVSEYRILMLSCPCLLCYSVHRSVLEYNVLVQLSYPTPYMTVWQND